MRPGPFGFLEGPPDRLIAVHRLPSPPIAARPFTFLHLPPRLFSSLLDAFRRFPRRPAPPPEPLRTPFSDGIGPMHKIPLPARRPVKTFTSPILLTPTLSLSAPRIPKVAKTRHPVTSNARQKRGISYTPHQGWFSYLSRSTDRFMVRSRYFSLFQCHPFRHPAAPIHLSPRSPQQRPITATTSLLRKILRTTDVSTRKTLLRFLRQKCRHPLEMSVKVTGPQYRRTTQTLGVKSPLRCVSSGRKLPSRTTTARRSFGEARVRMTNRRTSFPGKPRRKVRPLRRANGGYEPKGHRTGTRGGKSCFTGPPGRHASRSTAGRPQR